MKIRKWSSKRQKFSEHLDIRKGLSHSICPSIAGNWSNRGICVFNSGEWSFEIKKKIIAFETKKDCKSCSQT